ncbi:Ferroporti-1 [Chaetomium fimeti]|uniref:Solute carrier family 40 member n=1 Tax=Chaetomium fimeti TaxID=1854472 RepID=A0AAE0HLF2_9PEZI|nr:Ferroporti-1 [Chaetomium fimeti]
MGLLAMAFGHPPDEQHGIDNDRAPLLPNVVESRDQVPVRISRRLYTSHFLSTWNSRVFEFGAVLYLATVFPGTLLPMSVYALTRGLSAILFAPAIGHYVDTGNRLQVVRVSIIFQRLAVAASCVIFYILVIDLPLGRGGRTGMLVFLSFLACVEKLCSIMNLVSVEKDWVVVVADKNHAALIIMNAQIRRIDLLCNLFGPLFIALLDGFSTEVAIIVNMAMNVTSIVLEYFAIARVYYEVPALQEVRARPRRELTNDEPAQARESQSRLAQSWGRARGVFGKSARDFNFYFRHRAFLPSFAGALLYLTVLSFAGQMVTYLLSAGYTANQVGLTRTLSVFFEVLATWVAPWLMGRIGPVRAGLWLSSWQVSTLVAGITLFWIFQDKPVVSATGLVGGTILSRLGLRGFDLCVQIIVQEDVEVESRGAFSSVEAAWQNGFELLSFATTIIFSHPEQFKWPSLISVGAVASAWAAYSFFVYVQRGHLLHLDALGKMMGTSQGNQREREVGVGRITSETNI